ncbi:hypothetical protein ACFZAC_09600 [Pseudomonas fluorescens]|uniref:hypothetical protein n=1 Tax=Pseudomonas fluorescens TaxID=294 RepID=UPI003748A048
MKGMLSMTEGSMTASVENQDTFVANSGFAIKKGSSSWVLGATHRTESGHRHIDFHVPLSLAEGTTVFDLGSSGGGPRAVAIFEANNAAILSNEGTLIVEYFVSQQRIKGTFHFKSVMGNLIYNVTNGTFDLIGILDTTTLSNMRFTADLEGTNVSRFEADYMEVSINQQNRELAVVGYQRVWEPLPARIHRLTLFVPEGAKKGTYEIVRDGEVHAGYINDEGIYVALSGQLVLTADASETEFEASFEFSAEILSSHPRKVEVSNGVVSYTAPALGSNQTGIKKS